MRHELSPEECSILLQYGAALWDLASGRREPRTPAQVRFVEVAHGRAQAETVYEVAFVKALANKAAEEREHRERTRDQDGNLPEHEEGTPKPGTVWFADEHHWRYRP